MDDEVDFVQSLIRNQGIPRILRKVTCKSCKSPPIFQQFYKDKPRSRHLVPVAVNQLKIFRLPKKMDRQQENNGFGPLSKPRGKASLLAALFVVSFCVVVHLKIAHSTGNQQGRDEFVFLLFISALLTLSLAFSEVVRRVCLGIEEIRHKQTRYEGSWMKVFNSTFAFKYGRTILVVGVASFLIVSSALYRDCDAFCRAEYAIFFSLNCFLAPQLLFLVGLRELSSVEVSQINEKENKNVADGLAWSYYFGYLKLVLPHLEGQIGKSDYKYDITKKKLFILLPKNCYTYDKIVEADPRIKVEGNLDSYDINRGGILKRSYKHTVHRIEMPRPDGGIDNYYVVLEYATPLMSLYDMSEHAECGLSRQERDEQVVLFIRKLREILDGCKDCKGKYVLVPISGERAPRDERDGRDQNRIADVLVRMHQDPNFQMED